ncbi:hypothetical protein D3C72_1210270 [compost metagenome]
MTGGFSEYHLKNLTSTVEVKSFSSRVKKKVIREQKHCQYVDTVTQRKCESQWFVQVDHKQSLWAGGDNSIKNAQVLCSHHNKMKYRKEAGIQLR